MRFVVFHKNSESIRWEDDAVIVACAIAKSIKLQYRMWFRGTFSGIRIFRRKKPLVPNLHIRNQNSSN